MGEVGSTRCGRAGALRRVGLAGAVIIAGIAATLPAAPAGASIRSSSASNQIEQNWVAFFSGKTSATRKLDVLQDASEFASIVRGQASSPLAKGASAKVASVAVHGSTASVRYSVYLDGAVALKNESGEAIRINGTWKVTVASFCSLLDLEQVKTKACSSGSSK